MTNQQQQQKQEQLNNSPGQSSGISEAEGSTPVHQIGLHQRIVPQMPILSPLKTKLEIAVKRPQSNPLEYPLDVSVDENYEFDATNNNSPMDHDELYDQRLKQLRYRHWQTSQRSKYYEPMQSRSVPPQVDYCHDALPFGHDQPNYRSYRVPKNLTVEEMEARCNALKNEFLQFRRKQLERQIKSPLSMNSGPSFEQPEQSPVHFILSGGYNDSNTSSDDDLFESICWSY